MYIRRLIAYTDLEGMLCLAFAVLQAINEDSPTVPSLLTDYILKGKLTHNLFVWHLLFMRKKGKKFYCHYIISLWVYIKSCLWYIIISSGISCYCNHFLQWWHVIFPYVLKVMITSFKMRSFPVHIYKKDNNFLKKVVDLCYLSITLWSVQGLHLVSHNFRKDK